ncbi:MAG: thioesterase domain-containing protein [Pseudomonadales bacterium]|nr:thioesterase domain-containing protein [Pseudomonadales bacterium]
MILLPDFVESTFRQIPLLKAMGMEVSRYDGKNLALSFPLALNVNDKGTGFAGSLNAATTYCAWSVLHLLLKQKGFDLNLAVVSSQSEYRLPVTADFIAESSLPSEETVAAFIAKLEEKGKAGLMLESRIKEGEEVAVYYQGTYVAFPKS